MGWRATCIHSSWQKWEHGVLLSHPHLITLSRSSGANGVAREGDCRSYPRTTLGMWPAMVSWIKPRWVGLQSISPHNHLQMYSQGIFPKGCRGQRNSAKFGGFESTPPHICIPSFDSNILKHPVVRHLQQGCISKQSQGSYVCNKGTGMREWGGMQCCSLSLSPCTNIQSTHDKTNTEHVRSLYWHKMN